VVDHKDCRSELFTAVSACVTVRAKKARAVPVRDMASTVRDRDLRPEQKFAVQNDTDARPEVQAHQTI
jgi:hypothetical protein